MSVVPLRAREDVLKPDPWWGAFAILDARGARKRTIDDHYGAIAQVHLQVGVSEPVIQSFENARNTYFYAFFAHRLIMVAELQVRISVEFALREKAKLSGIPVPRWWGMKRFLKEAIRRGWIVDEGFERFRRNEAVRKQEAEMWSQIDSKFRYEPPADAQAYCRVLAESFPSLRNDLAHGSDMLYPSVIGTFEISADLINQLFPTSRSF